MALFCEIVVPEAKKFRTSAIDPEFKGMLDQMFMGIVATSDKAWTPFLGTLLGELFEDADNDILEENEEENTINDVHISTQVGHDFDGNNKKIITHEARTSHFKIGKKKSSK
ncbi:hypothetical protein J1N35_005839 [Gossypium stocksii]|uniref:Uncharacterized protein n=1 Tax=Gossypium stocksii TaxID=47602 RepID=A0A9D3WEM4_9ROSI|nr:hypothetical protein J1N35_005839 [Gossypium stocksii]